MTTMIEEFKRLRTPPPASFFKPPEPPIKNFKAKTPPSEVIAKKTAIIKAAAAIKNAERKKTAKKETLDALRKIGKPATAKEVGFERGFAQPNNARTTLEYLFEDGELTKRKDNSRKMRPIVYWFAGE